MNSYARKLLIFLNLFTIITGVISSNGDRTTFFINCREMCNQENCSEGKKS